MDSESIKSKDAAALCLKIMISSSASMIYKILMLIPEVPDVL